MRFNKMTVAVWMMAAALSSIAAERKEVRPVADFEADAELANFMPGDNVKLSLDGGEGVTSGKRCCHVATSAGDWAAIEIKGDMLKNWANFDFVALDVYTKHSERLRVAFELWDKNSKDFATRCTWDESAYTHGGGNTFMFPIGKARRNNKEGRDWEELEPKDKIDLNALKLVKIILPAGLNDGECHLWIDNIRLMQEDAAAQRVKVTLPASARAFDFGPRGIATPGFDVVSAGDPRLHGNDIADVKCLWPEPLTGGAIQSAQTFSFEAPLANGEYCVWLVARKVMNATEREFSLYAGGQKLCDEVLSDADFYGEKGIFRHLRTQYSQRPNALWLDFVEPVCPEYRVRAKVTDGKLTVKSTNFALGAMLLMPAAEEAEFAKTVDNLKRERMRMLDSTLWLPQQPPLQKGPDDKAYALWTTPMASAIRPWSSPPAKRETAFNVTTTPGEKAVLGLCVSAFEDLGRGDIEVSDLTGPGGKIPAENIKRYYQNYTLNLGSGQAENGALMPWTKIRFEQGTTWTYVLWLNVPADAKAGKYEGTVTFTPEKGGPQSVPLKVDVQPVQLIEAVPAAFGMYHSGWNFPAGFDQPKLWREMLTFLRDLGMTAAGGSYHFDVLSIDGNKAVMRFDDAFYNAVKAAGMGRTNDQRMWGDIMGGGRKITRLLNMQPAVDNDPGLELRHANTPRYKEIYKDMVRQIHEHFAAQGVPIVIQPADEPRQMPNPWNRNVADTITYLKMIKEVNPEIKTEEDLIGDTSQGVDNTTLLPHIDVLSVHAKPYAAKLIEGAEKSGKTIWIYNSARTRFSYGFFLLKYGAKGHFEWDDTMTGAETPGAPFNGYPFANDWYTPFCGRPAAIYRAPYATFPGGMLFNAEVLEMSEGVTDYLYIATLQQILSTIKDDSPLKDKAKEARQFLAAVTASMPRYLSEQKLASPEAAALVGAPADLPLAELCALWRRKTAEFIKALRP